MPSANNGNFALPRVQFQEDTDSAAELIVPQRRLSSADPLPLSNPSSSSFFSSQQQLPPGTFTNSGPFSRPPNAQQFILNGQQSQFQPIRSSGSLSFGDAVPAVSQPSFFQQAPLQRSQQQQQQQPQHQQQFNFFPSSSQQQRFRPVVQQQQQLREQPDSIENFDGNRNAQSSFILPQSSQERFNGDSSRRPSSQTNGIIPGARNPSPNGSIRWWNPTTTDTESVATSVNSDDESTVDISTRDEVELSQQRQSQQQKRGRGQSQQGRRRPITTQEPSSIPSLEEQEPAAIGFTVIHDENENRSPWSQPTITTHRPQSGQTSFRNRNLPAVVSGSVINRRPTTYNPLSVVTSSPTPTKSSTVQPVSSVTINKQQPTTVRNRKSFSSTTTTTTMSTLEDEQEEQEDTFLEEKRQFSPRKSIATTQAPPIPITTLRTALRPRLNSPATFVPQQQRMKKIVNNPAVVQSIITRKPPLTSTTTLAPTTTTNTNHKIEEFEEYDDVEYTTSAYTTSESPSSKAQTKLPTVTQSTPTTINQQSNNKSGVTTESWVVVASVQTSRSVSSSSMSGSGTNKNLTAQDVTTSTTNAPINKHRFNNKPTVTTTSTTTVESIIDKLDRVQSELSNGILYGSSSTNNNSSRILTDMQSGVNNDDKRSDVIISSFTTPITEKSTETTVRTTTPTTTISTTSTTTTTTKKTEEEDEDKEDEEEESDDSDKETTFVRKFIPSKQRTSTMSTTITTSTLKPSTQVAKKKSLIDSVKFDELLTSGLLPPGFNPKPPPAYKSKTITTTTTTEISLSTTNSISTSQSSISNSNIIISTTPSSTTTTAKIKSPKIKFTDDISALSSLLPPGFKLEDTIKPVESLSPSLLPPGYKPPAEKEDTTNKNKEPEVVLTTIIPTTDMPQNISTTVTSSTTGLVFPNSSGKGISGTRKPLPSSKKVQASVTLAPVIQKGWPVR